MITANQQQRILVSLWVTLYWLCSSSTIGRVLSPRLKMVIATMLFKPGNTAVRRVNSSSWLIHETKTVMNISPQRAIWATTKATVSRDNRMEDRIGRCPDGAVSALCPKGFSLNYLFPWKLWQLGQFIVSSILISLVGEHCTQEIHSLCCFCFVRRAQFLTRTWAFVSIHLP